MDIEKLMQGLNNKKKKEETFTFSMEVSLEDISHLDDDEAYEWTDLCFIKNKKDILRQIDEHIEKAQGKKDKCIQEEKNFEAVRYETLSKMFEQLRMNVVNEPILPMPQHSGWSYYIWWSTDGVTLVLEHEFGVEKLEFVDDTYEEDDEYASYGPSDYDTQMIVEKIKPRLLTVNEFAEKYGVESVTVRQWIRRGKIREVRKYGSEWRISELALPNTDRKYQTARYSCDSGLSNVPQDLEILEGAHYIVITQDAKNKKLFNIEVSYSEDVEDSKFITLDTPSREKFEYYLLSRLDVNENREFINLD